MTTRFCTECGAALEEGRRFCTECGAAAEAAQAPAMETVSAAPPSAAAVDSSPPPAPPVPPRPAAVAAPLYPYPPPTAPAAFAGEAVPGKDSPYEPITMAGYIGIMLLMGIPVIGQILTIVWACGGCRKINKRNLARAALIFLVISLVLGLISYFAADALLKSSGLYEVMGQFGGLSEMQDALKQLEELQKLQLPTNTP